MVNTQEQLDNLEVELQIDVVVMTEVAEAEVMVIEEMVINPLLFLQFQSFLCKFEQEHLENQILGDDLYDYLPDL